MTSEALLLLLEHLAAAQPEVGEVWEGWRVQRIGGGHNGVVYRARGEGSDLAVKFTRRDWRDRAGREHGALLALRQMGLHIAPAPVLLERERYEHPVVVHTWLQGRVRAEPPQSAEEWQRFLEHYRTIHAISPGDVTTALPRAVITATRAQDALARVEREMARIPPEAQPGELRALAARVASAHLPVWPEPAFTLCRVDPNTLNFLRRAGAWASVDWENAGWGDPAFEIGDLMAFPAYASVPPQRWGWFVDGCADERADPTFAVRVRTYYVLALVWWAAGFARHGYEIERGLEEERLVQRPPGWRESVPAQYARALEQAQQALQGLL